MKRKYLRMRFIFSAFAFCLFYINIYGQNDNKNRIECIIQEGSIIGAKFNVELKCESDFSFEIPMTDNFTFLKTLNLTNTHIKNNDTIVRTFSKHLEFICNKSGQIIFPKILVLINNDSVYTEQKVVNILSRDTLTTRKHDKETGLLRIDNIEEFDKNTDVIIEPILKQSKIRLGDSLHICFIIKTALSNKIEFLKMKNIVSDSSQVIYKQPNIIKRKLTSINGINYYMYEFLNVFFIPERKGKYLIKSGIIEVNIGIDKKTNNSFLKLIGEQEFKSIELDISDIKFKVK